MRIKISYFFFFYQGKAWKTLEKLLSEISENSKNVTETTSKDHQQQPKCKEKSFMVKSVSVVFKTGFFENRPDVIITILKGKTRIRYHSEGYNLV